MSYFNVDFSSCRPGLLGKDKLEFAKTYCCPKLVQPTTGKAFMVTFVILHQTLIASFLLLKGSQVYCSGNAFRQAGSTLGFLFNVQTIIHVKEGFLFLSFVYTDLEKYKITKNLYHEYTYPLVDKAFT